MGFAQRIFDVDTVEAAPRVHVAAAPADEGFAVVLARPERYEDAGTIASRFDDGHAVLVNLEAANAAVTRRVIDFLSGVAYALDGRLLRVSQDAYLLLPSRVETLEEDTVEEWEPLF